MPFLGVALRVSRWGMRSTATSLGVRVGLSTSLRHCATGGVGYRAGFSLAKSTPLFQYCFSQRAGEVSEESAAETSSESAPFEAGEEFTSTSVSSIGNGAETAASDGEILPEASSMLYWLNVEEAESERSVQYTASSDLRTSIDSTSVIGASFDVGSLNLDTTSRLGASGATSILTLDELSAEIMKARRSNRLRSSGLPSAVVEKVVGLTPNFMLKMFQCCRQNSAREVQIALLQRWMLNHPEWPGVQTSYLRQSELLLAEAVEQCALMTFSAKENPTVSRDARGLLIQLLTVRARNQASVEPFSSSPQEQQQEGTNQVDPLTQFLVTVALIASTELREPPEVEQFESIICPVVMSKECFRRLEMYVRRSTSVRHMGGGSRKAAATRSTRLAKWLSLFQLEADTKVLSELIGVGTTAAGPNHEILSKPSEILRSPTAVNYLLCLGHPEVIKDRKRPHKIDWVEWESLIKFSTVDRGLASGERLQAPLDPAFLPLAEEKIAASIAIFRAYALRCQAGNPQSPSGRFQTRRVTKPAFSVFLTLLQILCDHGYMPAVECIRRDLIPSTHSTTVRQLLLSFLWRGVERSQRCTPALLEQLDQLEEIRGRQPKETKAVRLVKALMNTSLRLEAEARQQIPSGGDLPWIDPEEAKQLQLWAGLRWWEIFVAHSLWKNGAASAAVVAHLEALAALLVEADWASGKEESLPSQFQAAKTAATFAEGSRGISLSSIAERAIFLVAAWLLEAFPPIGHLQTTSTGESQTLPADTLEEYLSWYKPNSRFATMISSLDVLVPNLDVCRPWLIAIFSICLRPDIVVALIPRPIVKDTNRSVGIPRDAKLDQRTAVNSLRFPPMIKAIRAACWLLYQLGLRRPKDNDMNLFELGREQPSDGQILAVAVAKRLNDSSDALLGVSASDPYVKWFLGEGQDAWTGKGVLGSSSENSSAAAPVGASQGDAAPWISRLRSPAPTTGFGLSEKEHKSEHRRRRSVFGDAVGAQAGSLQQRTPEQDDAVGSCSSPTSVKKRQQVVPGTGLSFLEGTL